MRVLFLSRWYPYPPNNGSKLRIFNLLQGLAQHHEVTLLTFSDNSEADLSVSKLGNICKEVWIVPWKPFDPKSLRSRFGFLSSIPRSVIDTYSLNMQQHIERALSSRHYDLVIASQWTMAAYSKSFQGLPALFEEVELGLLSDQFEKAGSIWEQLRYGLTWAKHKNYLSKLLRQYRACTVVSEQEKQSLFKIAPDLELVELIPNCIDLKNYKGVISTPQPNSLIFTGSFRYHANYQAMVWFLEEVFPKILTKIPNAQLTITGDHADKPLPMTENINLVGYVDDIQPLVASSWISVVPISIGGGTRIKILEAMALKNPVVSTSKGAEGLCVNSDENILIADTSDTFAEAVLRLLNEQGLRRRIADNAYQLVSSNYDWSIMMPQFLNLVEKVAIERTSY